MNKKDASRKREERTEKAESPSSANIVQLMKDLRASKMQTEIDVDLLISYVTWENNPQGFSEFGEPLDDDDRDYVQVMISQNDQWKKAHEELSVLYSDIRVFWQEAQLTGKITLPERTSFVRVFLENVQSFVSTARQRREVRYAFASVLVIVLTYGVLSIVSKSLSKPYHSIAFAHDLGIMRSVSTDGDDIFNAKKAFAAEEYDEAISFAEHARAKAIHDSEKIRANLILAPSYMHAAERTYLGLFPHFNPQYIRKSIRASEDVILIASRGGIAAEEKEFLEEEALFRIARAYLLIDEVREAKRYLIRVEQMDGPHLVDAQEMLAILASYEQTL